VLRAAQTGARHRSARSSRASSLPVVLKASAEAAATKRDDGVGTANGPEHTRLFEAGANDGFATCLNHSRTDEEVLTTELGIAHAFGISLEVIGRPADGFESGSRMAKPC
jgi:hypothetical protein